MNRLNLLPHGVTQAICWKRRFAAIDLSGAAAWRAVLQRRIRDALVESNLELLPPDMQRGPLNLVVDVGANEGNWLAAFLQFVQTSRVEVFEPIPTLAERLRVRFAEHPHMHIHAAAVGAQQGTAPFNVIKSSVMSSLLPIAPTLYTAAQTIGASQWLTVEDRIAVPVVMLDEALPDMPIDLLKIDVQGFERQVIAGAAQVLARTRAVLIETNYQRHYEGDALFPELWQLLASHDFRFWSVTAPHVMPDGSAWWADTVFVKDA